MNTNIKLTVVCVLLLSLLTSGCGPGQMFGPTITPMPTSTSTPIPTPTSTLVPTATNTSTPKPTATAPAESTIKTFELSDGTKFEVPQYSTAEEAMKYVGENTLWRNESNISRFTAGDTWLKPPYAGNILELFNKIKLIPGRNPDKGLTLPTTGKDFFTMNVNIVNGKALLIFANKNGQYEAVYVDKDEVNVLVYLLDDPQIPTPQP